MSTPGAARGAPAFHPDWLRPDWAVHGVRAVATTRHGGASRPPFDSLNLRDRVGDDPAAVAHNRAVLERALGVPVAWLDQVHGTQVVRFGPGHAQAGEPAPQADAAITTDAGVALAVQVADCLPVLFAAPACRGVGAAHAGWRGLAGGVLEATVDALCAATRCAPADIDAWLGPCIGPAAFEVGADVLRAFGVVPRAGCDAVHFAARSPGPDGVPKWSADLAALARERLAGAGVLRASGGGWCTVTDASRFFSFRRDGVTGRQAAALCLDRRA